jgi:putative cardiolipin synthase
LPEDYPRTPSTAFDRPATTALGELFSEDCEAHPDESGFATVRYGRHAFSLRIAMAEMAQESLDLQYYIWESDQVGRRLADALIRAADRGVRIRLLLDDLNITVDDAILAALAGHPNFEVRAFNPFAHRGKLFDFATDFGRVNHRMHNKVMVADNAFALVGGRNIGNHYFGVGGHSNFRDLDVAAVGPIVRDISAVFDDFWNGEHSLPYSAFVDTPVSEADTRASIAAMRETMAAEGFPYDPEREAEKHFGSDRLRGYFEWAPGKVLYDKPELLQSGSDAGIRDELAREIEAVEREVLIEAAYFVIRDEGLEIARRLRERGVRLRVLTNSMASNDVLPAHAGYASCRSELLAMGAELYELRPDPTLKRKWTVLSGKSKAGLHTKAVIFDRKTVFIGSYNLDPRSARINTEIGLLIRSEKFAEQVGVYMDGGVRPKNSYRVTVDSGHLAWLTEDDGIEVLYEKEPETSWWQRFYGGFLRMLPIKSQL